MAEPSANDIARQAGDDLLDRLHQIQTEHSGQVAIASAIGSVAAALNFIRSACGHDAALTACDMARAMVRDRMDVIVPVGKARS